MMTTSYVTTATSAAAVVDTFKHKRNEHNISKRTGVERRYDNDDECRWLNENKNMLMIRNFECCVYLILIRYSVKKL